MGFMPTFGVAKGEALCGSTLGARRKYMVVDKTSVHNMAIMKIISPNHVSRSRPTGTLS